MANLYLDKNFCTDCDLIVSESEFVPHIEECHVGLTQKEGLRIRCGESGCCLSLFYSPTNLRTLIHHCAMTGHEPTSVQFDWQDFVLLEEQRITELIRNGTVIERRNIAAIKASSKQKESLRKKEGIISPPNTTLLGLPTRIPMGQDVLKKPKLIIPKPSSTLRALTLTTSKRLNQSPRRRTPRKDIKIEQDPPDNDQDDPSAGDPTTEEEEDVEASGKKKRKRNYTFHSRKESSKRSDGGANCALCDYDLPSNVVGRGRAARLVLHVYSHDHSLYPLKCRYCDYRGYTSGCLTKHCQRFHPDVENEGGPCYSNIQDEAMIERTRALLQKAFPDIEDWNTAYPSVKAKP